MLWPNIRNIKFRLQPFNQLVPIELTKYDSTIVLEAINLENSCSLSFFKLNQGRLHDKSLINIFSRIAGFYEFWLFIKKLFNVLRLSLESLGIIFSGIQVRILTYTIYSDSKQKSRSESVFFE